MPQLIINFVLCFCALWGASGLIIHFICCISKYGFGWDFEEVKMIVFAVLLGPNTYRIIKQAEKSALESYELDQQQIEEFARRLNEFLNKDASKDNTEEDK